MMKLRLLFVTSVGSCISIKDSRPAAALHLTDSPVGVGLSPVDMNSLETGMEKKERKKNQEINFL